MRDTPMTELDKMTNCHIRPCSVISPNPGSRLYPLIVNDDYRKPLLVELGQVLGCTIREDSQKSSSKLCCQETINNLTTVSCEVLVIDTVENQIIRCLCDHFNNTTRKISNKRPYPGGNEHAN